MCAESAAVQSIALFRLHAALRFPLLLVAVAGSWHKFPTVFGCMSSQMAMTAVTQTIPRWCCHSSSCQHARSL